MPLVRVQPITFAIVYDGTNGTEIASYLPSGSVISDDGTTLVVESSLYPSTWTMAQGDAGLFIDDGYSGYWIARNGPIVAAEYQAQYEAI